MQVKQTRYNCDWDCSRQNKQYSESEKKFIQQNWNAGKSIVEIAKKLKRGYWAIEVQIMYNLKRNIYDEERNHNHNKVKSTGSSTRKRKKRPKDLMQKTQPPPRKKTRFICINKNFDGSVNSIKRTAQINRKFQDQKTNVIKTTKSEMQNHIGKLMGL